MGHEDRQPNPPSLKSGKDMAARDGRLVRETLSRQNAGPFTES
jgi:hypothetical protein